MIRAGRPPNPDTPLDAFITRKTAIDAVLARLVALSDDHFGRAPNEVNWTDVAELADLRDRLVEVVTGRCNPTGCGAVAGTRFNAH